MIVLSTSTKCCQMGQMKKLWNYLMKKPKEIMVAWIDVVYVIVNYIMTMISCTNIWVEKWN